MNNINEKETKEKNDKMVWRNIAAILLLFGLFVLTASEISAQSSPCDPVPYMTVNRTSVPFTDSQTNQSVGYSRLDIWRDGSLDHYIHIFAQEPADTVFKAHFNGVEIATLEQRLGGTANEYWSWEGLGQNPPIAKVGDVMSVTKNGEQFVSGTYRREQYNYEQVAGYLENGSQPLCSLMRANAYNVTRVFDLFVGFAYAPTEITKVSVNEMSSQSGMPGTEIANLPISSTNTTSSGWHRARLSRTQVILSAHQLSLLRQGLLRIVTHTAENPDGYSEITLLTQGINAGGDFEGDGIADLAVFRPSEQNWYVHYSSNNEVQTVNFGLATDKLVVGDYDSDNRADITSFQRDNPNYPGQGIWQILQSSDNSLKTYQWGLPQDIPLAVNIDTNNTTDLGVFRPSNGTWYILLMGDIIKPLANNPAGQDYLIIQWGTAGDIPLTGDFNNDGIDELMVFRPTEGNWYIYDYTVNDYQILHWGLNGDIPIAKDFDGDGIADLTVYRPSEGIWYIRSSLHNSMIARRFGLSGDIPVPADFDKDSVADIAVFRPSNGTWYVLRSSDDSFFAAQFGLDGDIPATAQR